MKTVYRLTLRDLQGFTQSLRDLAFQSLSVLNYTTLCRRAKTLGVELPILRDNEPIHLVVDSTDRRSMAKVNGRCASTATRSGARGVKSISRSTRIRLKCMPRS
ncbi:MAG: hypothetical protein E5299_01448 [Burkholderia gladioli]|nr:MAG: hypothetical protein E5299_01448 [Burkholderia gladioli]